MDVFKELEDSLQRAITKAFEVMKLDAFVIISHENGPEPPGDYAVINVLDMTQQGGASKSGMIEFSNNQAKEYAVKHYEALVQLNFFGEGSSNLAMTLHSQWRANSAIRERFLRNKLAPRGTSNLRRSPQLRDAVWVKGWAMDVRVGFAVRTIQDVDWADYVTVNGKTIPLSQE